MSKLHGKALNCQLVAIAVMFGMSGVSQAREASAGSIITRATVSQPSAKNAPLRARPTQARSPRSAARPRKASRPRTGFVSSCADFLRRALSPGESVTTAAPAALTTLPPVSPDSFEAVERILTEANTARQDYESSGYKEADKVRFNEKAQAYTDALRNYLDAKSIKYIHAETRETLEDGVILAWPTLALSSEGEHRLNRFAASMKRRYKVNLAFDFLLLRRGNRQAAYLGSGALLLSEDALKNERPTIDDIEEILHVRFAAERDERNRTVGHVPVQMYFVSDSPVRGKTAEHDYMTEMTFEDIWAQAMKISIRANQLKDRATPEDMDLIKEEVKYLAGMTESGEIAIERAQLSSLEGEPPVLNRRATKVGGNQLKEGAYYVYGQEGVFNFAVFVPDQALENAGDFSMKEMSESAKLIKFMREYYLDPDAVTEASTEETFAKALNFKGALYDKIAEMGRSRPTADAMYDMVASLKSVLEDIDRASPLPMPRSN